MNSDGARRYRAPGRVNIIGEHTDYSGGRVLPTTTEIYTQLMATARDDRRISVRSVNLDDTQTFDLDDLAVSPDPGWIDYAKGVAALLEQRGIKLSGADIEIDSAIPIGGGLSSSAALEVAIATALLDMAASELPPADIADLCRRAENEYAGVNCGIMDQFAIACCQRGKAIMIDCHNMESKHVRLPADIRLLVTDTGVKHALADGSFNQRTNEVATATEILAEHIDGMASLRDVETADLDRYRHELGDTLFRRCRHVVSENRRVLDACAALESGDLIRLGALINGSHASLRDDFEVSCDELDALADVANDSEGVFGSRMIGAGFGGCVLSVVEVDRIEKVTEHIRHAHESMTGKSPWMHVVSETDPAGKLTQQ